MNRSSASLIRSFFSGALATRQVLSIRSRSASSSPLASPRDWESLRRLTPPTLTVISHQILVLRRPTIVLPLSSVQLSIVASPMSY
ncbi:hypothetical protein F7734_12940 [Scytonema sp. UIC 10036]|uniref:hypothetical protein n=1 Tax=Scytonema sp. UIC 10036 TaxID=2304196 RepID=UPI0012DA83B2|nr:hypothetical protein [Scytonema sp. UIC 10036]MUG93286.1 hypothetical protein [Scytonema sp. UIC 10036]